MYIKLLFISQPSGLFDATVDLDLYYEAGWVWLIRQEMKDSIAIAFKLTVVPGLYNDVG